MTAQKEERTLKKFFRGSDMFDIPDCPDFDGRRVTVGDQVVYYGRYCLNKGEVRRLVTGKSGFPYALILSGGTGRYSIKTRLEFYRAD